MESHNVLNCVDSNSRSSEDSGISVTTQGCSEFGDNDAVSLPSSDSGAGSSKNYEDFFRLDESNSSDNMLDKQMQDEDQRAMEAIQEEENMLLLEHKQKAADEEHLKAQRYKRLMHLLNQSKFYSQFILDKMDSQKNNYSTSKRGKKSQRNGRSVENSQENIHEPPSKKRKRNSNYKIADVIDVESVKAAANQDNDNEEEPTVIESPRLLTGVTLRPYQLEGFSWLKLIYENGVNGLLADEMGLGKTVQSIALLCHLIEMGVTGPFIVIAPLSTLHNWVNEIKKFSPQVPVVLFHGSEPTRKNLLKDLNKKSSISYLSKSGDPVYQMVCPVVVTSYEMAIKSKRDLCSLSWKYLIVDEGHRIKNFQCTLARTLKQFTSTNRLLLTGTPLQNSLSELWSLLNFLLPEVFDDLDVFESWFDVSSMSEKGAGEKIVQQEMESHVISTMHQIMSPFLLRRVKSDVAMYLPAKKELLVYAPLTELQMKLYTATITRDFSHFKKLKEEEPETEYDDNGRPMRRCQGSPQASRERLKALMLEDDSNEGLEAFLAAAVEKPSIDRVQTTTKSKLNCKLQNIMMQCRKVVNHPYLVAYPLTAEKEYRVDEELLSSSGKMQVLDQLLTALQKRGHKVLLFSQMTKLLDIIDDYLTMRPQFNVRRLDGSVSLEERQRRIEEFNKDPNVFLFLLSTRAGNLGINLTAADTVIIYDSDWNPQQDLQAQDRCHRLGQTKPVLVLRLVTAATIDERIVERANNKRCLEKLIMKAGKFKSSHLDQRNMQETLNKEELLQLLEQRDHHSVYTASKGNAPGKVYSDEELDRILDRSDLECPANKRKRSSPVSNSRLFKIIN